jgi:hypothetical protein
MSAASKINTEAAISPQVRSPAMAIGSDRLHRLHRDRDPVVVGPHDDVPEADEEEGSAQVHLRYEGCTEEDGGTVPKFPTDPEISPRILTESEGPFCPCVPGCDIDPPVDCR